MAIRSRVRAGHRPRRNALRCSALRLLGHSSGTRSTYWKHRLRYSAGAKTAGRGRSMVASDSFAEFLREQLAPLGRVTMRRMFGKTGVFCDRLMFAMVTEDTLYFRVDDHNRAAFEEAES